MSVFTFHESPYSMIIFFPIDIGLILNFIAVELRVNGRNVQYRQYWFAWKKIELNDIEYVGNFWVYGRIKLNHRIGLSRNLLYIESSWMSFQKWEIRACRKNVNRGRIKELHWNLNRGD